MRYFIFTLILILVHFSSYGQPSDTIYANKEVTTSLLFPERINLTDIGSSDYLFHYEGNLLNIKAKKPSEGLTSLLVRYGDNAYFAGYLGYSENLKRFYYDYRSPVDSKQDISVGSLDVSLVDELEVVRESEQEQIDTSWVSEQFQKILQIPVDYFAKGIKRKHGLVLVLEAICNSEKLTLIRVNFRNPSSLPYKVEFTGLEIHEGSYKKGLQGAIKQIRPLISRVPDIIPAHGSKIFAFGYLHFAPTKKAKLILTIREKQGARAIQLSIPASYILNADPIY